MFRIKAWALLVLIAVVTAVSCPNSVSGFQNWPQFRGPNGTGLGEGNPPVHWDVESGENIRWVADVPGLGHSAPVVWGENVFLTTAVNRSTDTPTLKTGWLGGTGDDAGDQGEWSWRVICLNRNDGKIRWSKEVANGAPTIKRHLKATHANCSCATDGNYVVAFFGSEGLYCFDNDGNSVWKKDFGKLHSGPYNAPKLEWGFSSSPIIHNEQVIVQCDCINDAFVSVLDLKSGEEVRRIQREEVATWSTPMVIEIDGQTQLVCNGYKQMAGYDLNTGEMLWNLSGGGDVPVPTPLYTRGKILLTNGHSRSPTYAIDPAARGDLTPDTESEEIPEGLVWWHPRDGAYMPTPIAVGEFLYTCDDNGKLTVRRIDDGEQIYKRRVASTTFSASAVGTNDQIYLFAESGKCFVFRTGDTFELLATNDMKQVTMATPAISGDEILVRTLNQLICVGAEK